MTTISVLAEGCKVTRVIDGDTIEVAVMVDGVPPFNRNIRLLDCWAPELREEGGIASKEHLQELCLHEAVDVKVPWNVAKGFLTSTSFDRYLGHVSLADGTDLSAAQVAAGHATREKQR